MSGEVAYQYGERCVNHSLMDAFHGSDHTLFENGVLGFEEEKTLDIGDDSCFQQIVRGKNEGTEKVYSVSCLRVNSRRLLRLASIRTVLRPRSFLVSWVKMWIRAHVSYTGCCIHQIDPMFWLPK